MSLLPLLSGIVPVVIFWFSPVAWKPWNGFWFGLSIMGLISPYPDYFNVYQVLKQTPPECYIQNHGDETYWIENLSNSWKRYRMDFYYGYINAGSPYCSGSLQRPACILASRKFQNTTKLWHRVFIITPLFLWSKHSKLYYKPYRQCRIFHLIKIPNKKQLFGRIIKCKWACGSAMTHQITLSQKRSKKFSMKNACINIIKSLSVFKVAGVFLIERKK